MARENRELQRSEHPYGSVTLGDIFRQHDLATASPWQTMRRMQEGMDRIFNQLVAGGDASAQGQTAVGAMDISETDKEVCLDIDLPGFQESDIDIEVKDNQLQIRAEHKEQSENEENEKRYYRRERRFGSFSQTLMLTDDVNADEAQAEFNNGVLSIKLPKRAESEQRGRKLSLSGRPKNGDGAQQQLSGVNTRDPAEGSRDIGGEQQSSRAGSARKK